MTLLCLLAVMSLPVWAFVLSVVALICICALRTPRVLRMQARLAVKLYRRTGWAWTLNLGPSDYLLRASGLASVSGGAVGPNETISSTTRLANLEAQAFLGGISTGPALAQGAFASSPVAVYTAAGAIVVPPGTFTNPETTAVSSAVDVSGSTVLAMTLAAPIAGPTSLGGQDGTLLFIFADTTSKQHTITTPASGIQGSLHIITMAAAAFSSITLMAYNGSWWIMANVGPCVIS